MTIQEIFETPVVAEIEKTILDIYLNMERKSLKFCDGEVEAINKLLRTRRSVLAKMFVMDQEYKQLLSDFNEALKSELIEMRLKTIKAYESVVNVSEDINDCIYAEGSCFLGYDYSPLHPIQTIRAKKIWALLNNTTYGKLNPVYSFFSSFSCSKEQTRATQNEMLYLEDKEDNWNDEGFDKEMTQDMHIIYPVHELTMHMNFSIFDLLWVRDFNTEITIHIDKETHNLPHEMADIEWSKRDYR